MATLSIIIPDNQVSRINDAFADYYGYTPGSGMTKAQFARYQVMEYIRRVVVTQETNLAQTQAVGGVAPPPELT